MKIVKSVLSKKENKNIIKDLCNHGHWKLAWEEVDAYTSICDNKHYGYSYESSNQNLNLAAQKISSNVLNKLNLKGKIIRFMWNMYYKNQKSALHKDMTEDNFISILYNLHTTDGGTEVNNKFYKDKEGEAKIFKSNTLHRGIGPKKSFVRFNLNIVLEL